MKRIIKAAAAIAIATSLSACQTASGIDTANPALSANYQAERALQQIDLGTTHFNAGNYGMAQKHYRTAVESDKKASMGWLGLAAAYDQLGRFELADRAYTEVLSLEGRKPAILNNQGYSYILRGDMKKAKELLSEARASGATDPMIEANWKIANAI